MFRHSHRSKVTLLASSTISVAQVRRVAGVADRTACLRARLPCVVLCRRHPCHACLHPRRRRLLRCCCTRIKAVVPRLPIWEPHLIPCMNAWRQRCRRMAAVTRSCGLPTRGHGDAVAARAMGPTGGAPTITGRYGRGTSRLLRHLRTHRRRLSPHPSPARHRRHPRSRSST